MEIGQFIIKQIGRRKYTFTVNGKNFHEVLMNGQNLSFDDIEKCGLCQSDNLILQARITPEDNYEYAEVKCKQCKGALVFGKMKKSPDTYFLRRNDDGKFDWKEFIPSDKTDTKSGGKR